MLSSCGFSPFKTAFASIYVPDLPDWVLPSTDNAEVIPVDGFKDYPTWQPYENTVYEYVNISSGTYAVMANIFPYHYLGSNTYEFSGSFHYFGDSNGRIPLYPYAIKIRISGSGGLSDWYSWVDADVHVLDTQVFFTAVIDGSSAENLSVQGVCLFFGEPTEGNWLVPSDSDFAGVPSYSSYSSFQLIYSGLRVRSIPAPSEEEQYQDEVIGGIDRIDQDINKGFGSIKNEISSGTDDVVGAVDGVKDSVDDLNSTAQEWGQNIVNGITEGATAIQETITEESEKLGNFILDGLKSLFIPRDGYFKELFDDLNTFFSEVFGFLYFPIEHALSWFNRLLNLPEVAPSIAIPELAYEGEVLIPAQTYTFDFLQDEPFSTVHDYYLMAIDAAMIMSFVHLLQRKYEEVMRN